MGFSPWRPAAVSSTAFFKTRFPKFQVGIFMKCWCAAGQVSQGKLALPGSIFASPVNLFPQKFLTLPGQKEKKTLSSRLPPLVSQSPNKVSPLVRNLIKVPEFQPASLSPPQQPTFGAGLRTDSPVAKYCAHGTFPHQRQSSSVSPEYLLLPPRSAPSGWIHLQPLASFSSTEALY